MMLSIRQRLNTFGLFLTAIALTTACTHTPQTPPVNNPTPNNQTVEKPITEKPVVEKPAVEKPIPAKPASESSEPRVYWLKEAGTHLALAPKDATPVMDTPDNQLKKLFDQLLNTAPTGELSSTIPKGTKLLSLVIKPDGIVVNLSQEFTSGGGSASMTGRLAQVLYTATSTKPQAAVWLQIEGKPLETLGGEGLEIPQPITRKSFTENFEL